MIIFMGVAGSGKSMQGRMLADELALPWLSTGEFLRMLISGERRKDMLAGKLLDDHEIISLVQKIFAMIDVRKEFILDGFPRTTSQADWLLNQMKHGQLHVTAVINLKASPEVVKKRLLERGRPDDTLTAIKARFAEYEQAMVPLLEHFKDAGVTILDIPGENGIQGIHQRILESVEPLLNKA
jgi:adenylate kinase